MQQKIVLIGGPGTGKSTVLKEFISRGYECMPEISREVTLEAQKEGIDQLFLEKPLLFSELLLKGREKQFIDADLSSEKLVFFDRGMPDIHAYMDYLKTDYPDTYIKKCNEYKYDKVFMLRPWKEIYIQDNERYESFEQAIELDKFLRKTYEELGYSIIDVPFGSVKDRCDFIIKSIND